MILSSNQNGRGFRYAQWFGLKANIINHTTAIFRQVNKDEPRAHHDALEFPDGQIVLLTAVVEGQEATVLQLPAQPATAAEEAALDWAAYFAKYVAGQASIMPTNKF